MGISKITRNYQITLPKDIRELKHLKVGDKILFVVDGDKIDLLKADKSVINNAAGLWSDLKESGQEYERKIRKGWKKRMIE